MDFTYPPEAEAFRAEFRAWLDAHLTDEFRGEGLGFSMEMEGDTPRSSCASGTGLLADARYAAIVVARGVRRPRRRDHGAGGVRRGDAPLRRAGHAEPARPLEHRARDHRVRHRRAEAHAPPPHAARRRHLVPGILRAERRLRPRVAAVPGGARRRPLGRQRPEDVEHARPPRELVRAARAHRSRACRSTRASRACSST